MANVDCRIATNEVFASATIIIRLSLHNSSCFFYIPSDHNRVTPSPRDQTEEKGRGINPRRRSNREAGTYSEFMSHSPKPLSVMVRISGKMRGSGAWRTSAR